MTKEYDFKTFLKDELSRRCQENENYSLRAFARSLNCDPSYLSKVLNGKKNISKNFIQRISLTLNLPPEETNLFINNQDAQIEDDECPEYNFIAHEKFKLLSEWYYDAILEMAKLPDNKASSSWISQQLGIKEELVNEALERLIQFELIEIKSGRLVDLTQGHTTNIKDFAYSTLANRSYQRQILNKSITSLETIPIDKRDHSSIMMATNTEKLIQAKKMIKNFRRKLCQFMEDVDDYDCVYQLSLSIFPITETNNEENI